MVVKVTVVFPCLHSRYFQGGVSTYNYDLAKQAIFMTANALNMT